MSDNISDIHKKMLLVGDPSQVFLDLSSSKWLSCRKTDNLVLAAEHPEKETFELIAIVIPQSTAQFVTELKNLRQHCPRAKIVILAQMYQEPMAMIFVEPDLKGNKLADDYLICPLSSADFDSYLCKGFVERSDSVKIKVEEDKKTAERIRHLEKLATEDDLTGLKNRRYIWEFARQIIEYATKHGGKVTILIFDIDDFKHYNDQYGHFVGDSILKQTSTLIRKCCRKHDVVGRIGGDEFAVIFWDDPKSAGHYEPEDRRAAAEHPKEPVFIAQRFREQITNTEFDLLGKKGKGILTISGGLASFPRDSQEVDTLFKKADEALLEAKAMGKNQIYLVGQPNNLH
jgi:diguanylate cyclase (GGDEF)-like protein